MMTTRNRDDNEDGSVRRELTDRERERAAKEQARERGQSRKSERPIKRSTGGRGSGSQGTVMRLGTVVRCSGTGTYLSSCV